MITRRALLTTMAAVPAASAAPAKEESRKPLRGIFPIMQTPFDAGGGVDNAVLAKQVHFLDRCGVHGMVWPQLASEYFNLTKDERLEGAEAILAAGKAMRPAIVIGVQDSNTAQAVDYARHATRLGADAIIAIPPQGVSDKEAIFGYYKAIGEASPLPLFVQAIGDMSVEFIIRMAKEVPTLRYIKDEAGPVLARVGEFAAKAPELRSFTGNHGRTLYGEMLRGFAGSMPAASFADLYSAAWDRFHSGDRKKAAQLCAYTDLLIMEAETYGLPALKYMLHLRGVFPNWNVRPGRPGQGLGSRNVPFDDAARRTIAELFEVCRPFLRA